MGIMMSLHDVTACDSNGVEIPTKNTYPHSYSSLCDTCMCLCVCVSVCQCLCTCVCLCVYICLCICRCICLANMKFV